jgi:hypothetical protein
MSNFEYALENDEFFEFDQESDEAVESDESDEMEERRQRRRVPRIRAGRTASGQNLFRPRPPAAGQSGYVTQAQLQAGLKRVGDQIKINSESIKKVTAQSNKINAQLGSTTERLDKKVTDLKKEVKKQAEMSLLLTLLQPKPEIVAKVGATQCVQEAVGQVEVKQSNSLLPLLLLGGGLGGDGSGDNNTLLLALAASGTLKL